MKCGYCNDTGWISFPAPLDRSTILTEECDCTIYGVGSLLMEDDYIDNEYDHPDDQHDPAYPEDEDEDEDEENCCNGPNSCPRCG